MKIDLPAPSPEESALSAQLLDAIRQEIAAQGAMPFSRYMERCLYAPGLGYYSAGRTKFGAAGDFVTAPELGNLFAECAATTFLPTLRAIGAMADVVELGGGSGAFAESALRALQDADALPRYYRILEPSADLRERQRDRLSSVLPSEVFARVEWIDRPPEESWQGVLFANEVIDALPATRFTLRDGEVFEEHLILADDGVLLREDRPADSLVAGAVRHVERDLGTPFVDGYRSEILPQLAYWMQAVLGSLERGMALFVDYGYPRSEFYRAERDDGTLVCHYRHRAHGDALHLPGLQDLTAFVDFTALAEAGNHAGFELAVYAAQAPFLFAADLQSRFEHAFERADEAERYRLAQQVKRLTLPGEMGERFKVMLLAKRLTPNELMPGLDSIDESFRL
jgi:SAM-dependent MidA family methyltransferase